TDPTTPDEALPQAHVPPTVAEPAAAAAPPPPPTGDPLFDEPGYAAPAARSARAEGVDKKTLIGAGVGAAVIALGAVVGINLASSGADEATNTAATGPVGMMGQDGQAPAGPSGATDQAGQMPGGMQGGGQGGPSGTTGTVESIGDGTLASATEDGETVEMTTTDETEVSVSESGSADDVDEGDTVMVIGQSGDDGSVTAERVVERSGDESDESRGGPGGMGPVTGEVSSVDGDSFVVSTDSGDVTVTMTDATTIVIERQGSVDDLAVGDEVFVHTHTDDDGEWAERIVTGDELPDLSGGPGGMSGGLQGGPMPGGPTGQSGSMAPPGQDGTGTSSGSNLAPADPGSSSAGGVPGANAGPSGVTTS
ncbi:MAG TPA: DUF5666 domain-containing protein, partial [Acidimicrobiales bacterium]|nr:DUF5666 domain-containing protein [Acidimicrobiales bacterium]